MSELTRKTIDLDARGASAVAPFLEDGSPEHSELERIMGERLASDSAERRISRSPAV